MSHRRILSVNDIISHLEDNDDVLSADIYITPPDNYDKSDEDSGDEESSNINHLSRQQLLAQAEFRATVSSQSNLDIIESVSNEVSIDNNTHGDLSVQPPAKKKKMSSYPKVEESRYSSEDRENIRATTFLRTPRYSWASTGNTHPELGVGASVVLDLISKLPPGTYSFYMDNYFTSLPLLDEIKTLGHDATGTVRANRVEKAPLKEAKDMKKMSRGSFDQCTDTLTNITLVRYNDNNIVTVASTECGVEPLAKVECIDEDIHTYSQHLSALHDDFKTRFEDMLTMDIPPWIINPFDETEVANVVLQEELLELSTNEELKVKFRKGYQTFWLQAEIPEKYPGLWEIARKFLIAFPSSYLV
ncbi:unnamed protein product [Danaus chrysippus]|uniref:(African queen) hypothetical protein n=1 Tax=Danaus chrysippus TaxID=151541 RepID=A0A8J2QT32_9NEOP|nr:unnamed protein product [Danaus chrysippus]